MAHHGKGLLIGITQTKGQTDKMPYRRTPGLLTLEVKRHLTLNNLDWQVQNQKL